MITAILSLLACGGGLGFSLLVGLAGVFYLSVSKSRLERHEELSIKSLNVVTREDDKNDQTKSEVIEL